MLIEKCFGLLKRRFPALRHGIRLKKPEDICILITSALVLHNMLIEMNDVQLDEDDDTDALDISYLNHFIPISYLNLFIPHTAYNDAQRFRRNLINDFFA